MRVDFFAYIGRDFVDCKIAIMLCGLCPCVKDVCMSIVCVLRTLLDRICLCLCITYIYCCFVFATRTLYAYVEQMFLHARQCYI